MNIVLQVVLPLLAAAAVASLLTHRSRMARQIGRDPIVIGGAAGRLTRRRAFEVLLISGALAALADVGLNAIVTAWVSKHLGIRVVRDSTLLRVIGVALLIAGLLITSLATRQMGRSWRIGIDRNTPGPLATRGVYARVRHPIYTGALVSTAGLAAATGDMLAMALAAGCWVAMPIQARIEEEFLLSHYGDDYRDIVRQTGRFLPRR